MAKRSEQAGSTSHDGLIKSHTGPRGKPEATEVKSGRAQQALREMQGDDECQIHWDQKSNADPADSAAYRRKGTSGFAFTEGSGSLARNPKKAKPYPGENWTDKPTVQWTNETDYQEYDHSPSRGNREGEKRDPLPQPKGEYYTGARGESGLRSTRLNNDSQGQLSKPSADVFHNKDEKKQGINPGDRAEHTSAATDPNRREVADPDGYVKIPEAERKERGTAGSDALLKKLGRNGYRRNT